MHITLNLSWVQIFTEQLKLRVLFMVKNFADQTHQNFLFVGFTDQVYQYN